MRERDGRALRDARTLDRIDRLRIPPAWRDVHIAASAAAEIQAWGYDSRGRKQYRYHARAVERGVLRKYYRVRQLGKDLPEIRRAIDRDLRRRGYPRERVAATVVRLISEGFFRVGNERYLRENRTFGIATLRKSHVKVERDCLTFTYTGKGSIKQRQIIFDEDAARVVRTLARTPGSRLFRYRDGEGWADLTARDINDYLAHLARTHYTAKDFRTWGGTLRAAIVLGELGPPRSETEGKRNVALAMRLVAAELGNTPTICRQSYVHPLIVGRYVDDGTTIELPRHVAGRRSDIAHAPEERALIEFLDRYFPERRRRPRVEQRAA